VNKSGERSHAQPDTATDCGDVGLQAIMSTADFSHTRPLHEITKRILPEITQYE